MSAPIFLPARGYGVSVYSGMPGLSRPFIRRTRFFGSRAALRAEAVRAFPDANRVRLRAAASRSGLHASPFSYSGAGFGNASRIPLILRERVRFLVF